MITAWRERLRADATYFPAYGQQRTGKAVLHLGVKGILYFEIAARGGAWGGPVEGMRLCARSVARFLDEFARTAGG